jgi:hypothetical protein
MTHNEISESRDQLLREYPRAIIKLADDCAEVVAEIEPGRAVAVIDRSLPHFHQTMTEVYRVLRGTLRELCPGESVTIKPSEIHFARCAGRGVG